MRQQVGYLVAAALGVLYACGNDSTDDDSAPVSGTSIGPDGGEVSAGALTLIVPPGALDAPVVITAHETTMIEPPPGLVQVGPAYDLGPDGTQFAEPVLVRIALDSSVTELGPALHHSSNGTSWAVAENAMLDEQAAVVTGSIRHFSFVAPFAPSTSGSGGAPPMGMGGDGGATPVGAAGGMEGLAGSTVTPGTGGAAGTATGEAGADGSAGAAGSGGDPDQNPVDCLPAFAEVCGPTVVFDNQDPLNSENFDAVITDVEGTMQWAACTTCSILYRNADDLPRTHDTITFVIDNHTGTAYAGGSEIHLSTNYIQNYPNPVEALVEFRGMMLRQATYLYQANGGSSDLNLITGVTDFVRIRAGLYEAGTRTTGGSWDGAYTTSGFFFSWLAGPCNYHQDHHPLNDLDIGVRINALMPQGKAAIQTEIETTFGTDIASLWSQYQGAI